MLKIYPVCFGDSDLITLTRPVAVLLVTKAEGVLKVRNERAELVNGRVFLIKAEQQVQLQGEMLIGHIVEFQQALLELFLVQNAVQRNAGLYKQEAILPYTDHEKEISFFLMKLLGRLMYEVERRTAIAKDYLFILFKIVNPKISERGMWHSDEREKVDKLKLLIEANYKEERKPSFYAAELGMSVEKLRLLVRNVLGKRFYDVLNERTFAEANLLLVTDMPIGDIAYEVGFSHSSHFNMTYIRFYGISPGTYRKRNRKS